MNPMENIQIYFKLIFSIFLISQLAGCGIGDDSFFTGRPDLRKCASPMCGGWFISAVNKDSMTCADGEQLAECYVAEMDFDALNLSKAEIEALRSGLSQQMALLEGSVEDFETPFGNLGKLTVENAWLGAVEGTTEQGDTYSIADNGIRCIASPCPSYDAEPLNLDDILSLSGVDLSTSNASQEDIASAQSLLAKNQLMATGTVETVSGPAGEGDALSVSQFYLPLSAEEEPKSCIVTGCSSHICAEDGGMGSTCEWLPEYACYSSAECTVQTNGACGWTMNESLTNCLQEQRQ